MAARASIGSRKIVHVGFGKAGSTALQKRVFPEYCRRRDLPFLRLTAAPIRRHLAHMALGIPSQDSLDLPEFFVSSEALHGWDPYFWEAFAEANRRYFGADTHVLLVVREPRGYLTSLYVQLCVHEGNIMDPEEFFLPEGLYSPFLMRAKFCVDQFNYARAIRLYRDRFMRTTVVKLEALYTGEFMREFGVMEPMESERYAVAMKKRYNRSFSRTAVSLTMRLHRALESFGYSLRATAASEAHGHVHALRTAHARAVTGEPLLQRIRRILLRSMSWRGLMQSAFDRVVPYTKFILDFDRLPWIDLDALEQEYNGLPDVATYQGPVP